MHYVSNIFINILLEIECIPNGIAEIFKKYSIRRNKMRKFWTWFGSVLGVLIVLALIAPLTWKFWGWGFGKNPNANVECPVCETCASTTVEESTSDVSDVSCVVRMEPGEKADVFTETWDAERRVWVHLDSGVCEGPYCFSYDACQNPLETLKVQPFWTGHELSPVDNKPFDICYNFEGSCSR